MAALGFVPAYSQILDQAKSEFIVPVFSLPQHRSRKKWLGQVRLGKVRLGRVRLGQVRLGQVRLGQVFPYLSIEVTISLIIVVSSGQVSFFLPRHRSHKKCHHYGQGKVRLVFPYLSIEVTISVIIVVRLVFSLPQHRSRKKCHHCGQVSFLLTSAQKSQEVSSLWLGQFFPYLSIEVARSVIIVVRLVFSCLSIEVTKSVIIVVRLVFSLPQHRSRKKCRRCGRRGFHRERIPPTRIDPSVPNVGKLFVASIRCQVLLSTCHFLNMSFNGSVILLTHHFMSLSFYELVIL